MEKPIFILSFFALSLLLLVLFVSPKYQEVQVLKEQIEQRRMALQYREEYFSNLRGLEQKIEGYKEPLEKLNASLPEGLDSPSLFDFLQKAASETGLVVENMQLLLVNTPTEEQLGEAFVALSLSGSYSSLKNFLSVLEASARLIETEDLSFSSPVKGEEFHFDLKIKTYFH